MQAGLLIRTKVVNPMGKCLPERFKLAAGICEPTVSGLNETAALTLFGDITAYFVSKRISRIKARKFGQFLESSSN